MRYSTVAIYGVFIVLWFVGPVRSVFFQAVLQLAAQVNIDPTLIVIGQLNMPSSMPFHASQMYSRNIASLLGLMLKKDGTFDLNIGDEVVKGTVVTHAGQVVHEATQKAMNPTPVAAEHEIRSVTRNSCGNKPARCRPHI